MIKANELRIGNWVKPTDLRNIPPDDWHTPLQVKPPIEDDDFKYNPIPLTEEWLLKFGFEKVNKYMYTFEVLEDISSKVTIISEGKIDIDLNDM